MQQRLSRAEAFRIRQKILSRLQNAVRLGLVHPDEAREFLRKIGLAQASQRPQMVAVSVQTFPHVLYPWDPAVVKAIHEFDPRVMPVWITRTFVLPTGGIVSFGRHGIASHVPAVDRHAPIDPIFYKALTSVRGSAVRPTQLDFHVEHRNGFGGLPGDYMPFDWRVYRILRSAYNEWSWKERKQYQDEHGEEARKKQERAAAEEHAAYVAKTDEAWLNKHIAQFDDQDAARIAAGGLPYEAKPMVEVRQEKTA